MPELNSSTDGRALSSPPARLSHAARAMLLTVGFALLGAVAVDRWYARRLEERARMEIRSLATARRNALVSAATRDVGLLGVLVAFSDSRRSRAQLDAEFPTFVQGVLSGRGLKALQLVQDERIVSVWPLEGNERAVGLNVGQHPDARMREGFERAMEEGRTSITGPVPLVQGGIGLIVRQRLKPRAGFPDLAAVVLDVHELLHEAGIPDPSAGIRLEMLDRSGRWFAGDPTGTAAMPETISVMTGDGEFRLLAAPTIGWRAHSARWQSAMRAVLALILAAAGMVAWLVGRRRDYLEAEVLRSSTTLELVMKASRMGGWEEELATGVVRWSTTIDAIIGRQGGTAEGGIGRLADAVDPSDRTRLSNALARARGGETPGFLEEVRIRTSSGEKRWVLVMGDVGRDGTGRPVRIVGIVADATERRALEDRVRHAQRLEALGKLAGGVAHDFNNLLTAISAFGEFAHARADELPPDVAELVRADLDHVIATAHRGGALTEQLATFSRRRGAERTPLDVNAAIADLVPTLERLVAAPVRIETMLAPDIPRVLMDPGQLTQVMLNLVVNARDAMPEGGRVLVRTALLEDDDAARPLGTPAGRWVLVEVLDEGVGMSAEVRERIFEPYFTTKPMGRGTGLGLAVVYGLVESAGGSVTVWSVEGEGTSFRVLLPPAVGVVA